jgi:type I restriction enzyme S subunit
MSGFKETEIGLLPDSWEVIGLREVFELTSGKTRPAELTPMPKNGFAYPVYGGNGILGYSKENMIGFKTIVLGRVGAYCGNVYLTDNKSWISDNALYAKVFLRECDLYYLSVALKRLNLNRLRNTGGQPLISQSIVYSQKIAFPKIDEQHNIAHILSRIQSAIEAQEKIIQTTTELKKALMQKLFTEGLKGELQKETEIGLVPKSWNVKTIKDLVLDTETRNPGKEPNKPIKYVDVSSVSNQTFSVIGHQDFLGKNAPGRARKVVYTNDVIFATVRPTLKRVAKINREYNDEYCSTAFCVLRADRNKLDFEFLYQYLLTDSFIKEIAKFQSGANYPAVRDNDVRKIKIPYPELDEQKEMGNVLKKLDCKIDFAMKKSLTLQSLFKSMLHHLMTGQIRVKDIRFS